MRSPDAATPAPGATGNGRQSVDAGRRDTSRTIIPARSPQARRRRIPPPSAVHSPLAAAAASLLPRHPENWPYGPTGAAIARARVMDSTLDGCIGRLWAMTAAGLIDPDDAEIFDAEIRRLREVRA